MKTRIIAAMAIAASLSLGGSAMAQNLGEDTAWQFKTPAETAVQNLNLQLMEAHDAGLLGTGVYGGYGFGGPLGQSTAVNNYFQFIDQSQTTNNCSNTGVGSTITCGGSTNTVSNNQTSNNSSATSTTTVEGNTVTNTNPPD